MNRVRSRAIGTRQTNTLAAGTTPIPSIKVTLSCLRLTISRSRLGRSCIASKKKKGRRQGTITVRPRDMAASVLKTGETSSQTHSHCTRSYSSLAWTLLGRTASSSTETSQTIFLQSTRLKVELLMPHSGARLRLASHRLYRPSVGVSVPQSTLQRHLRIA